MSGGRARSEHTSPPTRGGEVCSAKCPCRYGAGTVASHSGTASSGPRCRGPARLGSPGQALAGCISYDGGERAPSADIASRPALL